MKRLQMITFSIKLFQIETIIYYINEISFNFQPRILCEECVGALVTCKEKAFQAAFVRCLFSEVSCQIVQFLRFCR